MRATDLESILPSILNITWGKLTSGKYFNKGVKALDAPDIGHVVREAPDKIVVFWRRR
jgi:uncharacterized protein YcsI (UPF0317 family)